MGRIDAFRSIHQYARVESLLDPTGTSQVAINRGRDFRLLTAWDCDVAPVQTEIRQQVKNIAPFSGEVARKNSDSMPPLMDLVMLLNE